MLMHLLYAVEVALCVAVLTMLVGSVAFVLIVASSPRFRYEVRPYHDGCLTLWGVYDTQEETFTDSDHLGYTVYAVKASAITRAKELNEEWARQPLPT